MTSMSSCLRRGVPVLLVAIAVSAAACNRGSSNKSSASSSSRAQATSTSLATAAVIDPGDGGNYHPKIDPANFVDTIDNPYLPLTVGSKWVYETTASGEAQHVEVTVLPEHHTILGISATVVRDTVSVGGSVIEDTTDWYAQDVDGNVWYLGEETAEYEGTKVTSTKGSWEGGVNGALPGIAMPADPTVGHAYRQEFLGGEAEDMAEVIKTGESAGVTTGEYTNVVVTREWSPLEPKVIEEKSYAPGVGQISEVAKAGETGSGELVQYTPGT